MGQGIYSEQQKLMNTADEDIPRGGVGTGAKTTANPVIQYYGMDLGSSPSYSVKSYWERIDAKTWRFLGIEQVSR